MMLLLALRGVLLALVLRAAAADEEDAALATTGCELTLHHQLDLPKAMVCAGAAFGPMPSARDGAPALLQLAPDEEGLSGHHLCDEPEPGAFAGASARRSTRMRRPTWR